MKHTLNINQLKNMFTVLEEEPRLRIINILLRNKKDEWVASPDLEDVISGEHKKRGMQQYMHRHFTYLHRYGIVQKQRSGVPTFYRIQDEYLEALQHVFELAEDEQFDIDLITYRATKKHEFFEEDKKEKTKRFAIIQLMQSNMPSKAVAELMHVTERQVKDIFNEYLQQREAEQIEYEKVKSGKNRKKEELIEG